jgi:hypothetical protein
MGASCPIPEARPQFKTVSCDCGRAVELPGSGRQHAIKFETVSGEKMEVALVYRARCTCGRPLALLIGKASDAS